MTSASTSSPQAQLPAAEPATKPLHPLVAVGLGVVAGLILSRLIRR